MVAAPPPHARRHGRQRRSALPEERQRQPGAGRVPEKAELERREGRRWRRSDAAREGHRRRAERSGVRGPLEWSVAAVEVIVVGEAVEAKRSVWESAARADGERRRWSRV
ncbi:hypothetical protein U9M48_027427 [Paspalum notatum var. saurae]|uniref:Uncharacterized protein n=1 Tax=Paspalum notatum var. saurae TaxID=547442 RepID=A0AAQ3WZF2_PASNO